MSLFTIYLFIHLFVDRAGSSLTVVLSGLLLGEVSRVYSALLCKGFSLRWLLCFPGSRVCRLQQLQHIGSVAVVHALSWPTAYGIFPELRSNPRLLHWQAGENSSLMCADFELTDCE